MNPRVGEEGNRTGSTQMVTMDEQWSEVEERLRATTTVATRPTMKRTDKGEKGKGENSNNVTIARERHRDEADS